MAEERYEVNTEQEQAADAAAQETAEAPEAESADAAEETRAADAPQAEDAEALRARFAEEKEELEKRYLRLQADFENFRRRTRQEKEELSAVVTQGILRELLPFLDNFERALSADRDAAEESLRAGVEMMYKQLLEALKKEGLEYIETRDKAFDPNFHQAVLRVQDETREDGMIAAELQKGYTAKGKVIRPSMVQVVANG